MLVTVTRYGEARLDRKLCLECGTVLTGSECVACTHTGKAEALTLVAILVALAVVLTGYMLIKFV